MERPNSGDLGPADGSGWGAATGDGVSTDPSSLTPRVAPATIPTGGFVNDKYAIKPSSTAEEVEKITTKEIKRCLFNHGHHQTVSVNNIDSFKYYNNSEQDTTSSPSHSQAIKDQLAPSSFGGLIGYSNALSHKYLDNEQQINANTKTPIKQSSDVKLSLQNYHCLTTQATTPVPAKTITIMSTVGKYFEWLHINSITIQSIWTVS